MERRGPGGAAWRMDKCGPRGAATTGEEGLAELGHKAGGIRAERRGAGHCSYCRRGRRPAAAPCNSARQEALVAATAHGARLGAPGYGAVTRLDRQRGPSNTPLTLLVTRRYSGSFRYGPFPVPLRAVTLCGRMARGCASSRAGRGARQLPPRGKQVQGPEAGGASWAAAGQAARWLVSRRVDSEQREGLCMAAAGTRGADAGPAGSQPSAPHAWGCAPPLKSR